MILLSIFDIIWPIQEWMIYLIWDHGIYRNTGHEEWWMCLSQPDQAAAKLVSRWASLSMQPKCDFKVSWKVASLKLLVCNRRTMAWISTSVRYMVNPTNDDIALVIWFIIEAPEDWSMIGLDVLSLPKRLKFPSVSGTQCGGSVVGIVESVLWPSLSIPLLVGVGDKVEIIVPGELVSLTTGSLGLVLLKAAVGNVPGVGPTMIIVFGAGGMVCVKGEVPVGAILISPCSMSPIQMLAELEDIHAKVWTEATSKGSGITHLNSWVSSTLPTSNWDSFSLPSPHWPFPLTIAVMLGSLGASSGTDLRWVPLHLSSIFSCCNGKPSFFWMPCMTATGIHIIFPLWSTLTNGLPRRSKISDYSQRVSLSCLDMIPQGASLTNPWIWQIFLLTCNRGAMRCISIISPISEVNISSGMCLTIISKLSLPWICPQFRWNMNLMWLASGLPDLPWTWYGIMNTCINLLLTPSWNQVILPSARLYFLQLARMYQSNMCWAIGCISFQAWSRQKR